MRTSHQRYAYDSWNDPPSIHEQHIKLKQWRTPPMTGNGKHTTHDCVMTMLMFHGDLMRFQGVVWPRHGVKSIPQNLHRGKILASGSTLNLSATADAALSRSWKGAVSCLGPTSRESWQIACWLYMYIYIYHFRLCWLSYIHICIYIYQIKRLEPYIYI